MSAATETTEALGMPASPGAPTRPFYWSVRRELWEHRALYIAPAVAACVVLLGFGINAVHLPEGIKLLAELSPMRQRAMVSATYVSIAVVIAFTTLAAAWFYCLDALQGERRDRSVLFWKSLPVSDITVVLTKLFTALVAAPAIAIGITLATELLILLLSTVVVLAGGASATPLWSNLQLFQLTIALLYAWVAVALWYAPIYAWLLLVSSWAKRSTFLWAVLPPIAIVIFEKLAFDTRYFADVLRYRFAEGLATAFVSHEGRGEIVLESSGAGARLELPDHALQLLDPVRFLSNPQLWVGLFLAAAFLAGAVWMRRYREPI